jgi:hypothetical protein
MGSAWGRGVREGPAPPGGAQKESAQQRQRQHGQGRGRPIKLDVMKEDQREQSERFSEQDKIV